ncbi:DUF6193 family natural product biosynthesis protein [Streptomyces sp. NBC_01142]|uniref:DUF6193 family natural product biosynthesis protein n=1 Tax=Streptomyces sp. NBC_01142 TaxID=2975865 RepID=UPI002251EEC1|nr:DUF6193 family natural product biosynthesis protein [Streptomyces sp. NBC_01142]MCX4819179.1 DUF6193 family natural product biosynthesis protein [Streptomyces sp. NBC_01142]
MTQDESTMAAADIVAARWQSILTYDDDRIDSAMVQAAHAHPHLRELYPGVSHGALYVNRCTGFPGPGDVGALFRRAGGGFMVIRHSDGVVLGEPDTLEEAIELIVANLPEGCGPAIIGTADDL